MKFQPISPFVQELFETYESLRPIYMSEGHFLNQFLWENYYKTRFATDDTALYLLIQRQGFSAFFAPLCREEDLPEAFSRMERYFHDVLQKPLCVFLRLCVRGGKAPDTERKIDAQEKESGEQVPARVRGPF